MCCLLVAGLALTGCAHKETARDQEQKARKYLIEGTVFLKQSDIVKAVESFAAAIKVAPDYFESYYLLAETFLRLKQFPQAASVMATAAKQFPDNGLVYYLLSVAHEGAGNKMLAIVAAKKSVELFNAKGDKEGQQRAMILLATLVSEAKKDAAEVKASAVEAAGEVVAEIPAADAPVADASTAE